LLCLVALTVCFYVVGWLVKLFARPFARPLLKSKASWTQEIVEIRLSAMCGNMFKLGFHIFASIALYMLVGDTDWLPRELGGSGALRDEISGSRLFSSRPLSGRPVSDGVLVFYLFATAYHIQEFLVLVVLEMDKPSYYEMFLHHCTALFLVYWSGAIMYHRVGVLVLIVHYVSDIPGYVCKVFVDTRLKVVTISSYICLLFGWGYLRLFVLPFVIMRETTHKEVEHGDGYNISFYLLSVLVAMHTYWFGLFMHMGFLVVTTGQTEDTQARLPSRVDVKDKEIKLQ